MYNNEIFWLCIGLMIIFIFIQIFCYILNQILTNTINFLYNLDNCKASDLKNKHFNYNKYLLIKNIRKMKNILIFGLTIIVVSLVSIVYLVNSNINNVYVDELKKEYNDFMGIQQFNIDSLKLNINELTVEIDSLKNQIIFRDSTINNVQSMNENLIESNNNMKNIIYYQNTMIKKFKKSDK